ncbi:Tctex-1 family-domain-containing protein [Syncephalis pseudoplumigaleata]|uniref:Tctex-1 family-domain-containing protein n=1 Tax=Syncephalis pseudoplumigaleata TaxID=1712513 RepID=A0A4P9YX08_9FUNG|nr:Tctex-1 family-domain-containing protein [Syncephalis pseudoplumigaleata]|eukprot:RKP24586.1 Tctex-1 family-domain-containing protein [Syncephalis pseudoplumigaleata]
MTTTAEGSVAETDQSFVTIRPTFAQKFRPAVVTTILQQQLKEKLDSYTYDAETASDTAKSLADTIKDKLKELELSRYKYVVNVVLGENAGIGARMDCRCFWDVDTDKMVKETYANDSLFCVVAVFGAYLY